jgi:carbamoyltransferase
MIILGINAYHGDAAAAIVRDGELIAAAEEERFNRIKHCAGFPAQAIRYCLQAAGASTADIDHIGISRDPSAHLHKKVLFAARRLAGGQRSSVKGQKPTTNPEFRIAEQFGTPEQTIPNREATATVIGDRSVLPTNGNGNGHGNNGSNGFFSQVKDRLANAAKIRDLRSDTARALNVPPQEIRAQFHNIEHHRAHLASAFFVSPFEKAALLSIDGFGDFVSTMCGMGEGNSIHVLGQVEYPHSAGIVYTATTQFLGFPHYGDEGKVMGLAPYGRPLFMKQFRDIIRTEPRGRFTLNLDYFRHTSEGVEMSWDEGSPVVGRIFSDQFTRTFGLPREAGAPLSDRERDIAASLQQRLEEVAFHILNHLHEETGLTDLGLAGGVAYNSVMNGKILLHTRFRRVFVQPAAGDSGTAVGVCYQIWNDLAGRQKVGSGKGGVKRPTCESRSRSLLPVPSRYIMEGAYTGPAFSNAEICAELKRSGLAYTQYSNREVTRQAARDIAEGKVVGWFQGRMEFGPRALGNRSILVDPRRAEMKDTLNERIKKREAFRPFAPSILAEHVGEYFEQNHPAPTMLMVYQVREEKRSEIPAVTHVDGTGRLQTVTCEGNALYYQLISDFKALTGVPVVLNTSFNENEPIVCTPREAIDCFKKMRMDVLYVGRYAVRRK